MRTSTITKISAALLAGALALTACSGNAEKESKDGGNLTKLVVELPQYHTPIF